MKYLSQNISLTKNIANIAIMWTTCSHFTLIATSIQVAQPIRLHWYTSSQGPTIKYLMLAYFYKRNTIQRSAL